MKEVWVSSRIFRFKYLSLQLLATIFLLTAIGIDSWFYVQNEFVFLDFGLWQIHEDGLTLTISSYEVSFKGDDLLMMISDNILFLQVISRLCRNAILMKRKQTQEQ
eukprot:TRINITY_DN5744_c1_g1_i4.p1 TRINITY_DN5744_c1_g1~~TRINITY_DN5744_c1_g1_i4.p1  ORF type:complete len:106 (+),score=14.00 TRINITY_DN5744_c1_g1_i4:32-349(+)